MFNIEGNSITITAGDSAIITVAIEGYELVTGDTLSMSVKKNINDPEYVFQKMVEDFEEGKAKIYLTPEDTIRLNGKYVYDIQVDLLDNRVQTIVPPSTFKVVKGVTD